MFIDFLLRVFEENRNDSAIVWKDKIYSYEWLLEHVQYWQQQIKLEEVEPGAVVIIEADFSPNSIALLLALSNIYPRRK